MPNLDWEDVENAAREAFSIWMSGSDLEWAKKTWGLLAKSGFCHYDCEIERHQVIGRFLALASLYRDWCSLTLDETQEDVPGYWTDGLDVQPIYLGQIVDDAALSDDPDQAEWEALGILMQNERPALAEALLRVHGDTSEGLFLSLWRSVQGVMDPGPGDKDFVERDDAEILNDATIEKIAAYAWISEGCPTVR